MVVKTMGPFLVPNIIRHLLFRYPKRDPYFDNYLSMCCAEHTLLKFRLGVEN